MAEPLYTHQGDDARRERFLPSALTAGPWSADAQHGGPVAALLARAIERADPPGPDQPAFQVVRLTVELLRPVPLQPLATWARVRRPGRKVRLVEATLEADGAEVARAAALQIRVAYVAVPEQAGGAPAPPLPPAGDRRASLGGLSGDLAFGRAVEVRFVRGSWEEPGPATVWIRLLHPVVDAEEPSPLQRVAAAADFGNGLSRILPFDTHRFINPDLTISLARPPEGPWIGLDMVTRLSGEGFGHAESLVFDRSGPVGRAVQSLLVETR
ncbi:MAG: thioesterase family protein [Acidimicrobiales bacterium]